MPPFHVTRLGFAAVYEVRRRIQQELTEHRGRGNDSLYWIRRLLRRGADHHSKRSWTWLLAGLDVGDTRDEQLANTWIRSYGCATAARHEPVPSSTLPLAGALRRH